MVRRDWGVSSSIQEEVAMMTMLLRRLRVVVGCFIVAFDSRGLLQVLITITITACEYASSFVFKVERRYL